MYADFPYVKVSKFKNRCHFAVYENKGDDTPITDDNGNKLQGARFFSFMDSGLKGGQFVSEQTEQSGLVLQNTDLETIFNFSENLWDSLNSRKHVVFVYKGKSYTPISWRNPEQNQKYILLILRESSYGK